MNISLKNIHLATKQQIFDQVATHLLTQHEAAQVEKRGGGVACLYRVPDTDLKCAGGCLIADDEYDPSCEGKTWDDAIQVYVGKYPNCDKHEDLITDLQSLHDEGNSAYWWQNLYSLAKQKHLDASVLSNFK